MGFLGTPPMVAAVAEAGDPVWEATKRIAHYTQNPIRTLAVPMVVIMLLDLTMNYTRKDQMAPRMRSGGQ